MRLLPVCHCLPKIGQMTLNLNKKTQRKLLVPNLMEVFETPVGSKLKPNLQDRETGTILWIHETHIIVKIIIK